MCQLIQKLYVELPSTIELQFLDLARAKTIYLNKQPTSSRLMQVRLSRVQKV